MPVRLLLALFLCLTLPLLGLAPTPAFAHVAHTDTRSVPARATVMQADAPAALARAPSAVACADAAQARLPCDDGCHGDPDGCACGCGMGACAHGPATALPASSLPVPRPSAAESLPVLASGLRADAPPDTVLRPPIG